MRLPAVRGDSLPSHRLLNHPVLQGEPRRHPITALALALLTLAPGSPSPAKPAQEALTLAEPIRLEALPLIGGANYLGLGAEARRLGSWMDDHRSPFALRPADLSLHDSTQNLIKVSPGMARALEHLNQWYGLLATDDHPITHEELKTGVLSPASIDRIRRIFEGAIRRGVRVSGKWITPEAGGEAAIDTELRLIEARDPGWLTVQALVEAPDPTAVASLYEARPMEMARVDTHGLLKVAIARFRLGTNKAGDEVRRAVATVAQNTAPTYAHDPREQFALIASTSWRGRYVGRWHTHSPHQQNGEWASGDVPSFEDMQNAVRDGQYLTLAFQPDGFDLYDAEPLADAGRVDLSLLKVIRYRSSSWRSHFRRLHPATR